MTRVAAALLLIAVLGLMVYAATRVPHHNPHAVVVR